MANPREIKAIAGNSASCLGVPIALPTGSNPVGGRAGAPSRKAFILYVGAEVAAALAYAHARAHEHTHG